MTQQTISNNTQSRYTVQQWISILAICMGTLAFHAVQIEAEGQAGFLAGGHVTYSCATGYACMHDNGNRGICGRIWACTEAQSGVQGMKGCVHHDGAMCLNVHRIASYRSVACRSTSPIHRRTPYPHTRDASIRSREDARARGRPESDADSALDREKSVECSELHK